MTGVERWSDEETLRMVRDERLAGSAAGDPLPGEHLAPGPTSRPPVTVSGQEPRGRGVDSDALAQSDPASVPRATWRTEIKGASGVNLVAGLWLVLSPFVLAYRTADPVSIQVGVGGAVAILALLRATTALGKSWMSWANAAFGLGIAAVAVFLGDSVTARWNAIVAGALILVLAILSASATDSAKRSSGRADRSSGRADRSY